MRIAINAITYTSQQGIETFMKGLADHFPGGYEVTAYTNPFSSRLFSDSNNITVKQITNSLSRWRLFLTLQFSLPFHLFRKNTVLFCPSLENPWLYKDKAVAIHDAAPFIFPEESGFIGKLYWKLNLYFAKKGFRLITVSEFSKRELENLGMGPTKLEIIYNGSPYYQIQIEERENFFLYIGNARPRKNLEFLLTAFAQSPEKKLIIAGKMDDRMRGLANRFKNTNINFAGYISETEKLDLLSRTKALIFPSLYEGFGIPILEAQRMSAPVICSDIPAFREVAGAGAVYFDPKDQSSFIKLLDSLTEEDLISLSRKGKENADRFSWDASAKKLVALLTEYEDPTNK